MPRDDVIYLDHAATTPLDERVLEAMLPYLRERFGNAASRHHALGRDAAAAVDRAREQVAAVLGADPREVVWTSGATESVNLALLGVARSPVYAGRRHVVSVRTEHSAVLDTCRHLDSQGFDVTWLPVSPDGRIELDRLADALRDDTLIVSVMHANNEIGVLQPIAEIAAICRDRGVLFHTDATQSFGKLPLDVASVPVDLLSLSAHKIHGPKGVGALWLRRRGPRVRCEPLLHGGGHERGLRSGTLNVAGIVGLGAAAALCSADESARISDLRDDFERALVEATPGTVIHGADAPRVCGITNLGFSGVDADALLARVPDVAASTASACTSAVRQPSYVLGALGIPDAELGASVRFSLGRGTTADQLTRAADTIANAVAAERA